MLLVRLEHIVRGVKEGVWPVEENATLLDSAVDSGAETPDHQQQQANNHRDTSTPLSEVQLLSLGLVMLVSAR